MKEIFIHIRDKDTGAIKKFHFDDIAAEEVNVEHDDYLDEFTGWYSDSILAINRTPYVRSVSFTMIPDHKRASDFSYTMKYSVSPKE